MKNRHAQRQRLHRFRAMQKIPAYLHPYVDETGELQRYVPQSVWERAGQTMSPQNGGFNSDASWWGLVPIPEPETHGGA
jgi:hypothetical protein